MVLVVMAIALPLGGHSTGYVSNLYYSAITPAGWAFSIWGLIYTGAVAFAVWQGFPGPKALAPVRKASPWIMGMLVANGAWLPAWHYLQIPLSMGIIFVYLFCAVQTVQVFARYRQEFGPRTATYWLGFVFFSVWAGWLTIATAANATVLSISTGLNFGLSEESWAVILLCIAFFIAWFVFSRWRSPAYFLVITWAFLAIASGHKAQWTVHTTALILAGLAAVLSGVEVYASFARKRA